MTNGWPRQRTAGVTPSAPEGAVERALDACVGCRDWRVVRGLIREDWKRLGRSRARVVGETAILAPVGLVTIWRLSHHWYARGHHLLAWFVMRWAQLLWGSDIHPGAHAGRRVHFSHTQGVILGKLVAGDDLHLYGHVVVGFDEHDLLPTIGDRVTLFTAATVIGDIHVGDDAKVGANSFVTRDIPARATALGVPARIFRGE